MCFFDIYSAYSEKLFCRKVNYVTRSALSREPRTGGNKGICQGPPGKYLIINQNLHPRQLKRPPFLASLLVSVAHQVISKIYKFCDKR